MAHIIFSFLLFLSLFSHGASTDSVRINNFPAIQPVSQSGTWNINSILNPISVTGGLTNTELRASPVPVSLTSTTVTNFPASQTVNGTVTANIGTTNGLALDASLGTLDISVNTLLKPSSTLASVSNVGSLTSITNPVAVTGTFFQATQPVSAATLPLPTGAATAALQTSGNASLSSIDSKLTSPISTSRTWALQSSTDSTTVTGSVSISGSPTVSVSNFPATQAISAASLPLPTGASTSALQTTGNNSLSSIDSKTPALGQALASSSVPVVLTAAQISTLTPLSSVSITGTANVNVTNASIPVTGTFFQATQPVSIAGTVTTTGTLTDAQLRATPVPVSGTVSTGGLTDAQLRASAVPVSLATIPLATNAATDRTTSAAPYSNRLSDGTAFISSIDDGNGGKALEVAQGATSFVFSTVNSSTVQLAAAATFTGTVESVTNQQSASILLTSDQNGTLVLREYIDAAGLRQTRVSTYTIVASVPFSRSFVLNGNYFKAAFTNNGGSTTTTFNLNTAYGTIPSATSLGNGQVSLDEINGTAFVGATKAVQPALALPTQDLKDSGRVKKIFSATFTAATTEALVTLTPITDGTAGGTATSFAVTATKRFRLQSVCVTTRNAGAAAQGVVIQVRQTATGAITATSPLIGTVAAGTSIAIANVTAANCYNFADGVEFSGTEQFGVSQVGSATANNTVVLTGYEY